MKTQNEKDGSDKNEDSSMQESGDQLCDMDRGWSWIVMLASFGSYCLIGATMYSIGIIHTALLDRFNAAVSTTSWACSLHSAVTFTGAPLSSYVIDRVSCRMAIILSGIFYTTGFFLTAFAPNIYVAIVTNGLIAGLGAAFGYTACLVVIGFNFKRYRNIASGVALSGIGIGMFCLAPLMQWTKTHYGLKGFFIIIAAMSANIITFGMLCFPSKLEMKTHKMRQNDMLASINKGDKGFPVLRGYLYTILNKGALCLCLCMLIYHSGLISIFLYLPSYVRYNGLTSVQASYVISMTGLTSALGRVFTGAIANLNKLPEIVLYSAPLAIVSVITFVLPILPKLFASYFIYSICLGLFFGGCFVVMPSVTLQYVSIQYLSTSLGLQLLFSGIGCLLGPVIAGMLIDQFESYDIAYIFSAICCIVAAILGFLSTCFHKQGDNIQQNDKNAEIEVFLDKSATQNA